MTVKAGESVRRVGTSSRPIKAFAAHNFNRDYYEHTGASGDVRGYYIDCNFTSTGSGEAMRLRGIAGGTLVATGGTVNALHATGRVASGKTVSGALNAIRATLEVAGTTPTPGGTLSAIQVDSNISTGATLSAESSFMRFTNTGAYEMTSLFNFTQATVDGTATNMISTHTTPAATHLVRCRMNGADFWLLACNTH